MMFSIIIPVYNVEKYISQCVDSILSQKYRDFEIILVDDGSPDKCPEICDNYAQVSDRITVIHKKNGGLSSARNCGTRSAQGKYVVFVDSDDYWDSSDALQELADELVHEPDICIFKSKDLSSISNTIVHAQQDFDKEKIILGDTVGTLKYLFRAGLFPGAAWQVTVKRSFLDKNNITFIEGVKGEDIDWLLKTFLNATSISAINSSFYVYRKYRSDSITGTADINSIKDLLHIIDLWMSEIERKEYTDIKKEVTLYLRWYYICAILIYKTLGKHERKIIKPSFKKYDVLLKGEGPKCLVVRAAYKIAGIYICSLLLNIYRAVFLMR